VAAFAGAAPKANPTAGRDNREENRQRSKRSECTVEMTAAYWQKK